MKKLYTDIEFNLAKSRSKLPLLCYTCNNTFFKPKNEIQKALKKYPNIPCKFCSKKCLFKSQNTKIECKCLNCNKIFYKQKNQFKKYKKHFCSRSCAATYNNAHKTSGTRRSKIEQYIESQLLSIYPQINILFNDKTTINSELDIYIPSLNLAFELNGIFHYEPIYGIDKLAQIQNNDNRKFQACLEQNIELCIIDTSAQKYFKEQTTKKYLDIIIKIINSKLSDI